MNPKTYPPVPVRGQNLHVVTMFASMAGFLVAMATHTPPTIPVWAMFAYSSFDFFVATFGKDFRTLKNAALVKFTVFSLMQILTCVAILVSVIIGDMSKGSEWLWGIIMFLFIHFGVLNIAETVHLWRERASVRTNERKLAAQSAIIEAFERMGMEDEEKKAEEERKVESALMADLAEFLNRSDSGGAQK